ncbi:MAG TPA: VOC family protein [Acidimicrobiales bacterium]|nr:VOC family protein [Acidimicrobiales bacterium]
MIDGDGMSLDTFFIEVGSTADVIAERDFFLRHLNMSLVGDEDDDDYVFVTDGTIKLGFLYGDRPENPALVNVGLTVDDVDAEVARLQGEGVVIRVAPETFSWGRAAALEDPCGLGVWLVERGTLLEGRRDQRS